MSPTVRLRDPAIRRSEIAIAILFLVTAAAAIAGAAILEPLFEPPLDLARLADAPGTIAAGAGLWTVNNLGFVFIALFAWPVLAPVAPLMARAYVALRVIEAGVMMLGVMALLAIPGLAIAGRAAADPAAATWQVALLHAVSATSLDAGMLPLLGASGLVFAAALLAHRLLPVWLAGLGVAAYLLVTLAGLLAWAGLIGIGAGDRGFLLVVPVAIWEILLMPAWLFWRGFTSAT